MKRFLIVRIGAFGDNIIITPLLRYLKKEGHEVYLLTSDAGLPIHQNSPYIDKTIHHVTNSIPCDKLAEYFESLKQAHECDYLIDLCESIEVNLALDSRDPVYKYPKAERAAHCNRNYYEETFEWASKSVGDFGRPLGSWRIRASEGTSEDHHRFFRPEMFFTQAEETKMADFRESLLGFRTILWGLSGSGRNKTYPYVPYIVGDIMRDFPKVKVILVGDEACQILEAGFPKHHRIIRKCGDWSMRESCLFTKYADLVVSPDTGLLHAAGCFKTPKIGLLGHTTIENITKHFENDLSLEATCACAPCFKIIQQAVTECPIDPVSNACYCMSIYGLDPKRVYERIHNVLSEA